MDKLKQWVALTVVAVLAVAAGGWVLLVSPKRADASDLRDQAAAQQTANAQLRTQIQVLKAQAAALPAEQAKIAAIAVKIPAATQQPELIRALQAAARTAGVELVSIAPSALSDPSTAGGPATGTPAATGTAAATGTSAGAGTAGTLKAMPVTLVVAGGYFDAEKYLAALEDLPRAFRVTGLTIAPGASPTTLSDAAPNLEDGQHLLTNITGTVYVADGALPLVAATVPAATTTTEVTR